MRYYVLEQADPVSGAAPYIVAEVVKDHLDDGRFRDSSAASNLAGRTSHVFSREELMAEPGGAAALRAWEQGDDSTYDDEVDDETDRIEQQERANENARSSRHLRLVVYESVDQEKRTP